VVGLGFQKDPLNRRQYSVEDILGPSSKVTSLLTDHNQTCSNCRACKESGKYGFSERSLE